MFDVQLDWIHYLLLLVSGVSVGMWLFRKDTEIENRRRAASKAAGKLREYGLTLIPNLLEDYSVGDYSGVATKLKDIGELLLDPKRIMVEFDEIFARLLAAKMANPDTRTALLSQVTKQAAANGVTLDIAEAE